MNYIVKIDGEEAIFDNSDFINMDFKRSFAKPFLQSKALRVKHGGFTIEIRLYKLGRWNHVPSGVKIALYDDLSYNIKKEVKEYFPTAKIEVFKGGK